MGGHNYHGQGGGNQHGQPRYEHRGARGNSYERWEDIGGGGVGGGIGDDSRSSRVRGGSDCSVVGGGTRDSCVLGGSLGTGGVTGDRRDSGGMVGVGWDDSGCDTGGGFTDREKLVDGGVGVSNATEFGSVVPPLVVNEAPVVAINTLSVHNVAQVAPAVAPPVVNTTPDEYPVHATDWRWARRMRAWTHKF